MRTEAQIRQFEAYRAKRLTPDAKANQREGLKRRWATCDPETKARQMQRLHAPEARRKAAEKARKPLADRFLSKVSPEPNSGCWLWLGATGRADYGQMRVDHKCVLATHVSLLLAGQPRPDGAFALHKCDNPNCVNPDHLYWGTYQDNARDAMQRGRADLSGLAVGHKLMREIAARRPTKCCEQCGTEFRPLWSQLRGNKRFFCSRICSVAWQKATYTGRPIALWRGK